MKLNTGMEIIPNLIVQWSYYWLKNHVYFMWLNITIQKIVIIVIRVQKLQSLYRMKTKKSNAGRKPVPDKKVQVSLYIRQSEIDKFGDIDKLKEAIYDFVALRSQNGA